MISVKKVVLTMVALAALLLAAPAEARGWSKWRWPARPKPRPAPEFDPAAAGAIATLLAGSGVILRRRRRN